MSEGMLFQTSMFQLSDDVKLKNLQLATTIDHLI